MVVLAVAGTLSLAAGETANPPSAQGSLEVASEPTGAFVYLDGEPQGATPLRLGFLDPGDHRLRLAKFGFLENSRVVGVRSGQSREVQVTLTPDRSDARRSLQVDPQSSPQKKGSGKKVLLIGLGVLAAGGITYAVLPKNDPPVAGTVGVSPSGTGLQSVTSYSFTAQGARDPDGDSLTYSWNFGDGGTGSGQSATHVYATAGSFNVSLTVSDGKKNATASGSVTVRNVSGTWVSTSTGTTRTWVLSQTGTQVVGTYANSAAPGTPGTVTATLGAPRTFTGSSGLVGFLPFFFNGTFNDTLTQLNVIANESGFVNTPLTFNRQ
jgi:hypothetical protein